MTRTWLISVSMVAHVLVGVAVFVVSVWPIEQLHAERRDTPVAAPLPSHSSSGAKLEAQVVVDIKVKHVVKTTVQPATPPVDQKPTTGPTTSGTDVGPTDVDVDDPIVGSCTGDQCGQDKAAVPACGNGAVELGEQCDDGNTADGDGCSSTCRREVAKPIAPTVINPRVMQGLRVAGDTQIHPDTNTQNQMLRDGTTRTSAVVLVCVGASGGVVSAKLHASTRYPAYDAAILSAVEGWRYRPYLVNGTPAPVCGTVSFQYTIN